MQRRISYSAALCAAAIALPMAAPAAPAGITYYFPPKLIKRGAPTSPIAGSGTVVVKVLVNPTGTFKVQGVVKSTNHGDDAAALEIARNSTYRPATRGGKKMVAFYDYTLKFVGNAQVGLAPEVGALATYERMLHAGNYSAAKSGLDAYVQTHATDLKGYADLGVANTYLNDYAAAVAAFDKAGTVPANSTAVAGKAYAEYAADQIKAKNYSAALVAGKKAVGYAPSFATYNVVGVAETATSDYASAVTDLEKARSLAQIEKISDKNRAAVDVNLLVAYLGAGNVDQAKTIAAESAQLDPANAVAAQNAMVGYYVKTAQERRAAGKLDEAAQAYEGAAVAVPSQAVTLYAQAALAYLNVKPKPDNAKARADADKALAIDPSSALANYAAGIALANDGKSKDALVYLKKADDAAKAGTDAGLTAAVSKAIKELTGAK